jgi:hypothetical protein
VTNQLSSGCSTTEGSQARRVAQLNGSLLKAAAKLIAEAKRRCQLYVALLGRWMLAKPSWLFSSRRQALTLLANHGFRLCSLTFELSCPRRQVL